MKHYFQVHAWRARELRLLTGLVLFGYIFTHLANHALGLVGLSVAERFLEFAKSVWYSLPGTIILYGAAAAHVLLALRTVYLRPHWRLPLIEYIRLAAGFSLPLLLIGHVVTTRLAFSLHGADPKYSSVIASLVASGNEGWQLALLAPGWLHGCLGIWLSLARINPSREARWAYFVVAAVIPCLAAAGFLTMRIELSALASTAPSPGFAPVDASTRELLNAWRKTILAAYLFLVGGAFLAGPVRRATLRRRSPPGACG
jgi:adenylate cyclase